MYRRGAYEIMKNTKVFEIKLDVSQECKWLSLGAWRNWNTASVCS